MSYEDRTVYVSRSCPSDYVADTLHHEICHAIVGEEGHGFAWTIAAMWMGCDPTAVEDEYEQCAEAVRQAVGANDGTKSRADTRPSVTHRQGAGITGPHK